MWQLRGKIKEDAFIWVHCLNISNTLMHALSHMQESAFTPSALPEDSWTLLWIEVIALFEFSTVIKYGGAHTSTPQCTREFMFLNAKKPNQAHKSISFWILLIFITVYYTFVFLIKKTELFKKKNAENVGDQINKLKNTYCSAIQRVKRSVDINTSQTQTRREST